LKTRGPLKLVAGVLVLFATGLLLSFKLFSYLKQQYPNHSSAHTSVLVQALILGFLPSLLIAVLLVYRSATRLSRIVAFAGELANGNFQSRLTGIESGDFGQLSHKLNETSAKLERTVQQLQTEHAELEKLERIRKDFVINVSHELRTPLASIQGYTETLMDGALDDQENNMRFLGIIRHNAERLARLTGDLLALSRIELKTQEFRFAMHKVNDLLADVLATILPIAEKKSINLKQEDAPEYIEAYCDSEAIYQILSNLLDNAVKYTPEHGNISVGARPLPNGMVEVYVRDSGTGIPVEDQPRLFERFYRVDKARSRELGGTGLGLAIVKHLVRSHSGDVRVESQIHQGATFFFTLPSKAPAVAGS
jgi:two-component system phosphate regulon sensor histidine kinase PhoR